MRNSVTCPIFRHMALLQYWSTTSSLVSPHDNWCSSVLTNILAWVCLIVLQGVCLCYTMVYKFAKSVHKCHMALACSRISSTSILKCKQMTLFMCMLNNIFPLDTKTPHYHLKYPKCVTPNVIMSVNCHSKN